MNTHTRTTHLHSIKMHRDIKPRNVLINRHNHRHDDDNNNDPTTTTTTTAFRFLAPQPLMLIDLGLADFYHPHVAYNVRVASRHYKAPELLLGYAHYDYAIDMWGVGCILVGLVFRREPFFRGKDTNLDQLGKIVAVLGTDALWKFVEKYQVQLSDEVQRELSKFSTVSSVVVPTVSSTATGDAATTTQCRERQSWLTIASSIMAARSGETISHASGGNTSTTTTNRHDDDALDLLDHLLVYDHEERYTAQQAMQHRYFDMVRERVRAEVGLSLLQGESSSPEDHP
jgi:casein kinase II subunit alpha